MPRAASSAPRLLARRSPFVGRDDELAALANARREAFQSHGSFVLITGEAGIGKTRLLREALRGLSGGRSPSVATGEALEFAARPYGAVRQALQGLIRANATLIDSLPPVARRALTVLAPDEIPSEISMPVDIDKVGIFTGVLEAVRRFCATRATVIALEDLHWADTATLELLAYLAARIRDARLLVLATLRDDTAFERGPAYPLVARLLREGNVHSVHLGRLPHDAVRSLMRSHAAESGGLEPSVAKDIEERSDGNPFFVEELLRHATAPLRGGALPDSIRAVVLERYRALGDEERDVVDHAAVLGPHFEVETLAATMDGSTAVLLPALGRIASSGIIVNDAERPSLFGFRHALTQEAIANGLLAAQRQLIHGRIASVLAASADDGLRLPELAYHAWMAHHHGAAGYCERAGDDALLAHAPALACTQYQRALEAAGSDAHRTELLGKLGDAARQSSDFELAIESWKAQHDLLLRCGAVDDAVAALSRAAGEMAHCGKPRDALALGEQFLTAHGPRLGRNAREYALAAFGRLATIANDFHRAHALLSHIDEPQRLDDLPHQLYWMAKLNVADTNADFAAWAVACRALESRFDRTLPMMRTQLMHTIASTAITFADLALAERLLDDAIALDKEYGYSVALGYAAAMKARVLHLLGRLREAREALETGLRQADALVVQYQIAMAGPLIGIALGDLDVGASCLLEQPSAVAEQHGAWDIVAAIEAGAVGLLLERGALTAARQNVHRVIGALGQFEPIAMHFYPIAARIADARHLEKLTKLCADPSRAGNAIRQAVEPLVAAIAAERDGNLQEMSRRATVALERFRALGWPLYEAQALELAGRHDAALGIYERCGSVADVRRLSAAAVSRPVAEGSKPSAPASVSITTRERAVMGLVAEGLSNRAIAARLAISEKTVEKHLTALYAKLGFERRSQLAAYLARNAAS